MDEVVEAVVEQDLGVEHHDHVDPDEHLEHAFVQVEVDRAGRLGVGAGPVEPGVLALAPYRELHAERAVADAVVVDPILEGLRLGGQVLHDEGAHGAVGALEQRLAGAAVDVGPEAFADLDDPLLAGAAAGDDGHEVAVVHLRGAGVVHQDGEGGLVGLAPGVDLDRGDADPLAEDRGRSGGHAARHRAADVHHVPEHRAEADQPAIEEDRDQHHPVVDVADGAAALVGVALQDDVARLQRERLLGQHLGHVGAELPDDHPALRVGDHRELVVLLADDRGHRGAEQHRVHLVARVAQGVLDQVEGDRIEGRGGDVAGTRRFRVRVGGSAGCAETGEEGRGRGATRSAGRPGGVVRRRVWLGRAGRPIRCRVRSGVPGGRGSAPVLTACPAQGIRSRRHRRDPDRAQPFRLPPPGLEDAVEPCLVRLQEIVEGDVPVRGVEISHVSVPGRNVRTVSWPCTHHPVRREPDFPDSCGMAADEPAPEPVDSRFRGNDGKRDGSRIRRNGEEWRPGHVPSFPRKAGIHRVCREWLTP